MRRRQKAPWSIAEDTAHRCRIARLKGGDRWPGADWLRLAALLSIICFHVVLRDALFARAMSLPTAGTFDTFIVASTVFDNRSLAILSFFLLFARHDDAPYGEMILRRAKRLLLPYVAWTAIYPFLDLVAALLNGQATIHIERISSLRFWISGFFLATMKEHLHFLPTLFALTLVLPIYRVTVPFLGTIVLIVAASIIRTAAEFFIIGSVYSPSVRDLILLSGLRLLEYLPLGVFAFGLYRTADQEYTSLRSLGIASIGALLLSSVLLTPERLGAIANPTRAQILWLIAQAVCGTIVMCLAAHAMLRANRGSSSRLMTAGLGQFIEERALAIFLIHPFFIDLFEAIIGAPRALSLPMLIPKVIFALLCSVLSSSVLIHMKGLRTVV